MRQKIDTVRTTTTRSAAEFESQLSTLREELNQQRRFRSEQLEELALEAAEGWRLQIRTASRSHARSRWPPNGPCRRSTPRCSGSTRARTESASAVPSRSRANG